MLAEIVVRCLILLFGYAYPAMECFKAVEKSRVRFEELIFWCRYWIIVAIITILERIGDVFISWLPMYGELKLAILIYLWYPKTKGTGYVFETLLRPLMAQHETDIERKLKELRIRAWDFAIYYWHNCTELGQTKFLDMFPGRSESFNSNSNQGRKGSKNKKKPEPSAPPVPYPNDYPSMGILGGFNSKWPPSSPKLRRSATDPIKSNRVEVQLDGHTEYVETETSRPWLSISDMLKARLRLRRTKSSKN